MRAQNIDYLKRVLIRSLMKRSVPAFILLWASFAFSEDFNVDFLRRHQERAAESSFSWKKYPEAREAFEKLAATARDPIEKNMWQARIAAYNKIIASEKSNSADKAKAKKELEKLGKPTK